MPAPAQPARLYPVTVMDNVEVYRVGNEAVITLQPSTGYVSVVCAWHDELNGAHYWAHLGPGSLRGFLLVLNRSYVVDKLFGRKSTEEFDQDATVQALRAAIIEQRREARESVRGGMTAQEARDLWDEVDNVERADDVANLRGIDEPWYYIRTRDKACVAWFWNSVWASFIAHLRSTAVPA
ncbi:MAG: hypothetical protein H0W72_16300 [Planctomycetes bacterium]|nr:hypothetical protein [Planctomycetota bacterium]